MVLGCTENQGKSINIDLRASLFLLKTVLHPCKRALNMLDGFLPFLGGLFSMENHGKSLKITEKSLTKLGRTMKVDKIQSFAVMVSHIPLMLNGNEQTRGSNSVARDTVAAARAEGQQYVYFFFLVAGKAGACMKGGMGG